MYAVMLAYSNSFDRPVEFTGVNLHCHRVGLSRVNSAICPLYSVDYFIPAGSSLTWQVVLDQASLI